MSFYSKDHQALPKALSKQYVKFLIIGGHAAIYDLDILVEPSEENGANVIRALKELDLEISDLSPEE